VKPGTVILHSRADDVVPFTNSEELARSSGATLIEVGTDHRLADPEPLAAMLKACNDSTPMLKTGDVVRAVVRKTAVFGLFCEFGTHQILVLIPEISWIPSFASCDQVGAVGDELEIMVIQIDRERNKIAGSLVALHPESDPWHGKWQLGVGDVMNATVVRWVERADRCGDTGGYLLALRPAALVMLCGQEAGRFKSGDTVAVKVTAFDARTRQVTVGPVP
jgi:predicted RNA-binding protein with RPS1 domain